MTAKAIGFALPTGGPHIRCVDRNLMSARCPTNILKKTWCLVITHHYRVNHTGVQTDIWPFCQAPKVLLRCDCQYFVSLNSSLLWLVPWWHYLMHLHVYQHHNESQRHQCVNIPESITAAGRSEVFRFIGLAQVADNVSLPGMMPYDCPCPLSGPDDLRVHCEKRGAH